MFCCYHSPVPLFAVEEVAPEGGTDDGVLEAPVPWLGEVAGLVLDVPGVSSTLLRVSSRD